MKSDHLIEYFSTFPSAEIRSADGGSSLKICTYSYAYPVADNEWDADWHRNYLQFVAPSFRAEIDEVILNGHELNAYLHELREFSALKRLTIDFEPMEPYFELSFALDSRKKVIVHGNVQYPAGYGTKLEFEFETDLTYVDRFANGIESILKDFPPRR
jgi:hypothetical protein